MTRRTWTGTLLQNWLRLCVLLVVSLWAGVGVQAQTTVPAELVPATNMNPPRIDLQAVEQALLRTKVANPQDFVGWMRQFEDEVNAIYFATLRRQYPQTDPTTLMPSPVRVDVQWQGGMLYIYGYINQDGAQGFQYGQDLLLFVLQQTKNFDSQNRRLYYSLRDGNGYYYRDSDYYYTWNDADYPSFLGFYLYPSLWAGPYWRLNFPWWATAYWTSGLFYSRYLYYHGLYPRYMTHYRRHFYHRYRPWGWRRGVFYRSLYRRHFYRNRNWYNRNQRWHRQYRNYLQHRRRWNMQRRRWNMQRRRWHRQYRPRQQYRRFHRQRPHGQYRRYHHRGIQRGNRGGGIRRGGGGGRRGGGGGGGRRR